MKFGLCPSMFRSWLLRTIDYGARIGIILHCVSGCCKAVRIASRFASKVTIGLLAGWIRRRSRGFGLVATQSMTSLCVRCSATDPRFSDPRSWVHNFWTDRQQTGAVPGNFPQPGFWFTPTGRAFSFHLTWIVTSEAQATIIGSWP